MALNRSNATFTPSWTDSAGNYETYYNAPSDFYRIN